MPTAEEIARSQPAATDRVLCAQAFKEFRNIVSDQNANGVDLGYVNPLQNASLPPSLFPPSGEPESIITFEPLPQVVPHRPPNPRLPLYNKSAVRADDWFGGKNADFPREQLHYLRECGQGWFGKVVEGEARGILLSNNKVCRVFVRILKEDASVEDRILFLHEAKPYKDLSHPNVLKLLGRCLENIPFLLVFEGCSNGDLKSYLRQNAGNKDALVLQGTLLRMAVDIATGLNHMLQHGFIHTDVAARNCLVTSDLRVKVGDYGTSIQTYKEEYYCTGDIALPIRWCAPETLKCTETTIETKQVNSASCVWSYGVLLWEVEEWGELPYKNLTDDEVICRVLGQEAVRLPLPSLKTPYFQQIYDIMEECWKAEADRPSFIHLINKATTLLHRFKSSDFEYRWQNLKPNTVPVCDNDTRVTSPSNINVLTRGDSDSGIETDNSRMKTLVQMHQNSSTKHKQVLDDCSSSPTSSSRRFSNSSTADLFSSSSLSLKQRSPSLENLHGSLDNIGITKCIQPDQFEVSGNFNSEWFKMAQKGENEFTHGNFENTGLEENGIFQPMQNSVLDFRLGPVSVDMFRDSSWSHQPLFPQDSLQDDSLLVRKQLDSSTDTEDEIWRKRIERGEFSEKVKEKSKSVADLMVLTHIDCSESSESDSLPSLTRQNSLSRSISRKTSKNNASLLNSLNFGSESNLPVVEKDAEFQEALKKIQIAKINKDEDSLNLLSLQAAGSLISAKVAEHSSPQNATNTKPANFLANEASYTTFKNSSPNSNIDNVATDTAKTNDNHFLCLNSLRTDGSTVRNEGLHGRKYTDKVIENKLNQVINENLYQASSYNCPSDLVLESTNTGNSALQVESVVLGPSETYTLEYFKGLKTTLVDRKDVSSETSLSSGCNIPNSLNDYLNDTSDDYFYGADAFSQVGNKTDDLQDESYNICGYCDSKQSGNNGMFHCTCGSASHIYSFPSDDSGRGTDQVNSGDGSSDKSLEGSISLQMNEVKSKLEDVLANFEVSSEGSCSSLDEESILETECKNNSSFYEYNIDNNKLESRSQESIDVVSSKSSNTASDESVKTVVNVRNDNTDALSEISSISTLSEKFGNTFSEESVNNIVCDLKSTENKNISILPNSCSQKTLPLSNGDSVKKLDKNDIVPKPLIREEENLNSCSNVSSSSVIVKNGNMAEERQEQQVIGKCNGIDKCNSSLAAPSTSTNIINKKKSKDGKNNSSNSKFCIGKHKSKNETKDDTSDTVNPLENTKYSFIYDNVDELISSSSCSTNPKPIQAVYYELEIIKGGCRKLFVPKNRSKLEERDKTNNDSNMTSQASSSNLPKGDIGTAAGGKGGGNISKCSTSTSGSNSSSSATTTIATGSVPTSSSKQSEDSVCSSKLSTSSASKCATTVVSSSSTTTRAKTSTSNSTSAKKTATSSSSSKSRASNFSSEQSEPESRKTTYWEQVLIDIEVDNMRDECEALFFGEELFPPPEPPKRKRFINHERMLNNDRTALYRRRVPLEREDDNSTFKNGNSHKLSKSNKVNTAQSNAGSQSEMFPPKNVEQNKEGTSGIESSALNTTTDSTVAIDQVNLNIERDFTSLSEKVQCSVSTDKLSCSHLDLNNCLVANESSWSTSNGEPFLLTNNLVSDDKKNALGNELAKVESMTDKQDNFVSGTEKLSDTDIKHSGTDELDKIKRAEIESAYSVSNEEPFLSTNNLVSDTKNAVGNELNELTNVKSMTNKQDNFVSGTEKFSDSDIKHSGTNESAHSVLDIIKCAEISESACSTSNEEPFLSTGDIVSNTKNALLNEWIELDKGTSMTDKQENVVSGTEKFSKSDSKQYGTDESSSHSVLDPKNCVAINEFDSKNLLGGGACSKIDMKNSPMTDGGESSLFVTNIPDNVCSKFDSKVLLKDEPPDCVVVNSSTLTNETVHSELDSKNLSEINESVDLEPDAQNSSTTDQPSLLTDIPVESVINGLPENQTEKLAGPSFLLEPDKNHLLEENKLKSEQETNDAVNSNNVDNNLSGEYNCEYALLQRLQFLSSAKEEDEEENPDFDGWVPTPMKDDENEGQYLARLNVEVADAIRNELTRGLPNQPCTPVSEVPDSEESTPSEEDHMNMTIDYNLCSFRLSPIAEEDEDCLSSNVSSSFSFSDNGFMSEDSLRSYSSGNSQKDLPLEPAKQLWALEPKITMDLDGSNDKDTILKGDSDKNNVKEEGTFSPDDVLIVNTITNEALILEDLTASFEISVSTERKLNETYDIENDTELNSDIENLDSDSMKSYTPDSATSSKTGAPLSYSSSESGNLSDVFLSPSSSKNFDDMPFDIEDSYSILEGNSNNSKTGLLSFVESTAHDKAMKEIDFLVNTRTSQYDSYSNLIGIDENSCFKKAESNSTVVAEQQDQDVWLKSFFDPCKGTTGSLINLNMLTIEHPTTCIESHSLPADINFNVENWPSVEELEGSITPLCSEPDVEVNTKENKDLFFINTVQDFLNHQKEFESNTNEPYVSQESVNICNKKCNIYNTIAWKNTCENDESCVKKDPNVESSLSDSEEKNKTDSSSGYSTLKDLNASDMLQLEEAISPDKDFTTLYFNPDLELDCKQTSDSKMSPESKLSACTSENDNSNKTADSRCLQHSDFSINSNPLVLVNEQQITNIISQSIGPEDKTVNRVAISSNDFQQSNQCQLIISPDMNDCNLQNVSDADDNAASLSEDSSKIWSPTISSLFDTQNFKIMGIEEISMDDMMSTSFIETDSPDGSVTEQEQDQSSLGSEDDSDGIVSTSNEFIWQKHINTNENSVEKKNGKQLNGGNDGHHNERNQDDDDDEDDEDEDNTDFTPSSWNSSAMPNKSALKSPERKVVNSKKNVKFKKQKYHSVYEYPKEEPHFDNTLHDNMINFWNMENDPSYFGDYSAFSDWELEDCEETADDDNDDFYPEPKTKENKNKLSFYSLNSYDCDTSSVMALSDEQYLNSQNIPFIESDLGPSVIISDPHTGHILNHDDLLQNSNDKSSSLIVAGYTNSFAPPANTMLVNECKTADTRKPPLETFESMESNFSSTDSENENELPMLMAEEMGELCHTKDKLTLDLSNNTDNESSNVAAKKGKAKRINDISVPLSNYTVEIEAACQVPEPNVSSIAVTVPDPLVSTSVA